MLFLFAMFHVFRYYFKKFSYLYPRINRLTLSYHFFHAVYAKR